MARCDNWRKAYSEGQPIMAPACDRGFAILELTITYREGDSDTLLLCRACANRIARDARKHGYAVRRRKL